MTTLNQHPPIGELTYAPDQAQHSPRALPPASAHRDECPLCAGTTNQMGRSDPRWNETKRRWTRVCVIHCHHCAAASFATFVCSPDGELVTRAELGPTSRGLLRSPERFDWFVARYPELCEVFEG